MAGIAAKTLRAAATALVAAAAFASPAAAADCENESIAPSSRNVAEVKAAVLCLVNSERADRGLRSLAGDARLGRAALRHSRDMVDRGYFDHRSPNGATMVERAKKARYFATASSWSLAENLAWGTGSLATPKAIVRGWMNSPGHRANILNGRLREAGLGVAMGTPAAGSGGATYTMLFGTVR